MPTILAQIVVAVLALAVLLALLAVAGCGGTVALEVGHPPMAWPPPGPSRP